jgi:hypothetical protein
VQDRQSLRDLDGVRVSVEPLTAEAVRRGLDADQLGRAAEERLRAARLTLLGTGDFPVGDPFLRIRVDVSAESHGVVACTVAVDFVQMVFMRRNPAVTFNRAQTWAAPVITELVEPAGVQALVTTGLDRALGQFVSDYRAVN